MELRELAGRIRNGDKNALKELIAAYGGEVYQKAYEKTKDPELAREATRRTFAQFVGNLQDQSGADGWSLWLDALAGKNIDAFRRVSEDVDWVGRELDGELFGQDTPVPPPARIRAPRQTAPDPAVRRDPRGRPQGMPQPSRPVTERKAGAKKARVEELFPLGPVARKKKRKPDGWLCILPLFLLCALLLWVVLGVAMSLGWLPGLDLGYRWFNQTIFKFF